MNKRKISIVGASLVVTAIFSANCFAGGWQGSEDYSTDSSSRTGGSGSQGEHKDHWYHYEFLNVSGTEGNEILLMPQWSTWSDGAVSDGDKRPMVSGECAASDVGFWVLARGTDGQKVHNETISVDDGKPAGATTYDKWYTDETVNLAGGPSNKIDGAYFYINKDSGIDCEYVSTLNSTFCRSAFAPYETLSANNTTLKSENYNTSTHLAHQRLYKVIDGTSKAMYENDRIAGSENEITTAYKNYMRYAKNEDGSSMYSEATIDSVTYETLRANKVFAFCSFPEGEPMDYKTKSKIAIIASDGNKDKVSDWGETNATNSSVLITQSDTISLQAQYAAQRNKTSFAVNELSGAVTSKITVNPSLSGFPVSDKYALKGLSIGVAEFALQNGENVASVKLAANTEYTFCASSTLPGTTLTMAGDSPSWSGAEATSSACVKVKYEPNVAEIDSETKVMVSGVDHSSGKDSSGEYNHGLVEYGVNALTAKWSYNLSSNARCKLANFNGKVCNPASDSINDKFTVPYQLFGDIDNANDKSVDLTSPDYWSGLSGDAKTVAYNLLPGESLQKTQSLNHYAGVRQDGSKANSDTIQENSAMTLKATAKNAVCKINDQEFGLSNPINYGRLTVTKNASSTTTYGDNSSAGWNNSIWLRPEDKVVLGYEACLGAQIKKDKDSGKAWDATLDSSDIITLGVGTTDDLLDNSHYKITGNAVDKDGTMGKSIAANEVIGDTVTKHLAAEYQFAGVKSREAEVGNLGRAINNDFVIRTDGTARATFKIPYNYILEPKINPGLKGVITVGNSNAFTLSISNHDTRVNKQVQDTAYHTNVKPGTRASYLVFAASTASTTEGLLQSLDGKFVYGDKTGDIQSALSGLDIQNAESGSIDLNADGSANKAVKVNSDKAIDGYNKICAAIAVYPADSHNMQGEIDIDNDSQYNALTDDFGAAYTRISVSCKTVGKYPTASVEGNGIVTSEEVKGSYTTYNGRNFGSWSEYGLVANNVTDFASGASVAYAISNPQTTPNRESDPNSAGLKDGDLDSLQTHGNLDKDNVGLQDASESSVYHSQARTFVDAVKSSFFDEEATNVFNLEQVNDSNIYVNKNHDKNITIGEAEAQKINNDVPSGSIVIIYTSGNISISNKIEKLNATLIAEDTIDTCVENEQGGDNGQLLDDCYNQLVVNGIVYSGNAIKLDRVYGGGSTSGMNLDAQTLVQRAEVFNYNPDYIKSIYQYTLKTQPLTTTYIEELSTRY